MVNQWLLSALGQLLPSSCPLCDVPLPIGEHLCKSCHNALPLLDRPCPQCGLVLPVEAPSEQCCGSCQTDPPDFDRLIATSQYAPPMSQLIMGFKFHRQLQYARLFAQLLANAVQQSGHGLPEIILPVPLHASRQRQRGYNQALEIARLLSRWLDIPVARNVLQRIRATAAQSDLDAAARIENVRGAFKLRQALPYRHVALLDDVVTTGNTVNEITRVLKKSGVQRVDVWCIARVVEAN